MDREKEVDKIGISESDIKNIVENLNVDELKEKAQEVEIDRHDSLKEKFFLIAARGGISEKIVARLLEPDRIIELDIPIVLERKSQGKEIVKIFTGFWIEHNNILGEYKGPINFVQNLDIKELNIYALYEMCKNALLDLPFGSAAGGVAVNKKLLLEKEIERLAKNYINSLSKVMDLEKNVLSAGFGCEERSMSLMYNTYKNIVKKNEKIDIKKNFLSKQMQDNGLKARSSAIARGTFSMIEEVLKQAEVSKLPGLQKHEDIIKKSQREIKIAILGFDAIEKELALLLYNSGYKIVAISDSYGGIASVKGIDPADAIRWQRNHRSVVGMPKTVKLSNEQMLGIKADILILSVEQNINSSNVGKIKAEIIFELQPVVTSLAAAKLENRIFVPFVVAACPKTFAEYLEFLQNQENKFFDVKEINKKIEEKSIEAMKLVYNTSKEHGINLQDACYFLALQKIANALNHKG